MSQIFLRDVRPTYVFDLAICFNSLLRKAEQEMTYRKVNTKPLLCNLELFGRIAVSQESEHRDNIHDILHVRLLQHGYIHSLTGVWV